MRPISEGPDIPERVPPAILRAWATTLRRLQAEHDRAVARAQAAARRAADLTPRLLSFARGGQAEHTRADISVLCAEVVQLLREAGAVR